MIIERTWQELLRDFTSPALLHQAFDIVEIRGQLAKVNEIRLEIRPKENGHNVPMFIPAILVKRYQYH